MTSPVTEYPLQHRPGNGAVMSEVIRCRDCKYGKHRKNARGEDIVICKNPDSPWLEEISIMPDWYCADAELTEKDGATVNSPVCEE